jgi:hypothetical protein
MTDIEKASREAVDAARQGERYAEILAVVAAQAAQAQQVPQVVHVHQAAPDKVLQRVALGAGAGGGAVAAGVVYGPLIVAAFTSIAITLLVLALAVAVLTWGIVTVVRAVGGTGHKTRRR